MELLNYLQSRIQVPQNIDLVKVIKTEEFAKNHLLHRENTICQKMFFLEKGLARIFYYKAGKEITFSFVSENSFTTLADSFFTQIPTRYNIELLEPCIVSSVTYEDLMNLYKQSHVMESFGRIITTEFLISYSERLNSLQFQTAEERYHIMQVRYSTILSRISIGDIASYLGMTRETLRRLRAKKNTS